MSFTFGNASYHGKLQTQLSRPESSEIPLMPVRKNDLKLVKLSPEGKTNKNVRIETRNSAEFALQQYQSKMQQYENIKDEI